MVIFLVSFAYPDMNKTEEIITWRNFSEDFLRKAKPLQKAETANGDQRVR